MKQLVLGILAHVDAGKTTLSEGLLYVSGAVRKLGRVDHGNAFLDTDALERERGITIFAKQAELETQHARITLLDTPGHVDITFSSYFSPDSLPERESACRPHHRSRGCGHEGWCCRL